MRILAGLFGLAALLMLAGAGQRAEAAQPPRVPAYDCGYLANSKGAANVWQVWFRGQRPVPLGPDEHYTAAPCFTSEATCKAWLYWAQSDWPNVSTFQPCRKGIRY